MLTLYLLIYIHTIVVLSLCMYDTQTLVDCLRLHGLNHVYLQENLVNFASDEASDMLGKHSVFSNLIILYCMNHRLVIALADAVDFMKVVVVNHFQSSMDELYSL